MSEFPYFKLWVEKWVANTRHLEIEPRGLYMDLLILMWESPDCRVPADRSWLKRRLNLVNDRQEKTLENILEEFCKRQGNWIVQKRLLIEREAAVKLSARNSKNRKSQKNKEPDPNVEQTNTAEFRATKDWGAAAGFRGSKHTDTDTDIDKRTYTPTPQTQQAMAVIELFDGLRVAVFGKHEARPYPDVTDLVTAGRWIAAGASEGLIESVFVTTFERRKRLGQKPIDKLSYFNTPITEAIAAAGPPPPFPPVNGTPVQPRPEWAQFSDPIESRLASNIEHWLASGKWYSPSELPPDHHNTPDQYPPKVWAQYRERIQRRIEAAKTASSTGLKNVS